MPQCCSLRYWSLYRKTSVYSILPQLHQNNSKFRDHNSLYQSILTIIQMAKEAACFKLFSDLTAKLNKADKEGRNQILQQLEDITEETKLLSEVIEIREELHIIHTLLDEQSNVLSKFQETMKAMRSKSNLELASYHSSHIRKLGPDQEVPGNPEYMKLVNDGIHNIQALELQAKTTYLSVCKPQ